MKTVRIWFGPQIRIDIPNTYRSVKECVDEIAKSERACGYIVTSGGSEAYPARLVTKVEEI